MLGKKTGMKQIKMLILWFVFGVRILFWDFPSGSVGKEFACNAGDTGDMGSIPGLARSPGGENGNPLQYSCLENPMHRALNLTGYSPWGHKESDTTEACMHACMHN